MARILFLAPQLPYPPHQGTTIRNFNLIAGLARNHIIDLATFVPPTDRVAAPDDMPLAALQTHCRQIVTQPQPTRSLAQRARDTLASRLPDMALRLSSPAMTASLRGLLADGDYDIIQVEGIEMAPYVLPLFETGGAYFGKARPRLVFDDHNAEYVLQQRAFLTDIRRPRRWVGAAYSLVQWRKLCSYERRMCRLADRVAAVSEVDRQALQRLAPGLDVTVVPNGVDLDYYRTGGTSPAQGMGPHALVFTGKMDYRPNVDGVLWFVDAVLPLICRQMPDTRFYVVGQKPHARLTRLTGNPAVTITGWVPEVRPFIAGAGVYVIPLRIGGGTRLKVLEAMAMGQAIVSTRLGCDGFPLVDGREAVLVDSPVAFAAAVVALLEDRERATALGRAARAFVEAHYGWQVIVPLMEQLYR